MAEQTWSRTVHKSLVKQVFSRHCWLSPAPHWGVLPTGWCEDVCEECHIPGPLLVPGSGGRNSPKHGSEARVQVGWMGLSGGAGNNAFVHRACMSSAWRVTLAEWKPIASLLLGWNGWKQPAPAEWRAVASALPPGWWEPVGR